MKQSMGIFAQYCGAMRFPSAISSVMPDKVRYLHTLNNIYSNNKRQMYLWK